MGERHICRPCLTLYLYMPMYNDAHNTLDNCPQQDNFNRWVLRVIFVITLHHRICVRLPPYLPRYVRITRRKESHDSRRAELIVHWFCGAEVTFTHGQCHVLQTSTAPIANKVFPSALLYAGGMLDLFITMARAGSALLFGLFVALSSNLSEKCRWRGGPSLPKMKSPRLLEGHSYHLLRVKQKSGRKWAKGRAMIRRSQT